MKVSDGPRERCLSLGVEALADHELLMLLLGSGQRDCDVRTIALGITQIDQWKQHLACLNMPFVASQPGIGPAKTCMLMAAIELGKRLYAYKLGHADICLITSAQDVWTLIKGQLVGLITEKCWLLLLSPRNEVLSVKVIAQGSELETVVDRKKIFHQVLTSSTRRFIIIHNHPSHDCKPSGQDRQWTRAVIEASLLMDVAILDHVVITHNEYYSFREQEPALWRPS